MAGRKGTKKFLVQNFSDLTSADGSAPFPNSKAKPFLYGNRIDQLHLYANIVTRHNHRHILRELDGAGHIGCAEEELRPIVSREGRVTAAFFFGEDIDFGLEALVGSYSIGSTDSLVRI